VEQHTHTQGLRTDTTHIRPPDQSISQWYYTKPTRTTDRTITTTENHQSTITSKKGPKAKIKKQGYTVSQGRVKQKPHTGGKSKIPGKLKGKEENNQNSPPHSITTKSPPGSSNPRKTSTYHTTITNQNHYNVYNHNLHTILTILTNSIGLALAYNIQRY